MLLDKGHIQPYALTLAIVPLHQVLIQRLVEPLALLAFCLHQRDRLLYQIRLHQQVNTALPQVLLPRLLDHRGEPLLFI